MAAENAPAASARGQRIAVIGAGLAGLAAAWWLRRRHEVVLYERQAQPGFTAQSVSVADPGGASWRVDVPLRVFYPGYYPTLGALYEQLGVASEAVSYAATLCDAQGQPYFRYRNWRRGDRSLSGWAPADALLGLQAWRIGWGLLRFAALARREPQADGSIGEFAARHGLPADFVEGFLLPAICTVCTCPTAQAREVPAEQVLQYVQSGLRRQAVRRALHGADEVQARLLAGLAGTPALQCRARIRALHRTRDGVQLKFEDGSERRFDHVVLATQANQALALLGGEARLDEAAALAAFAYVPVQVLTHRDASLMPARRRHWSPVNLRVARGAAQESEAPEATIWINAVQPALRGRDDLFQTVHSQRSPREETILGRAEFERPLLGPAAATAWQTLERLHREPSRRVWFCGSYAQAGIPLLESAARSALAVARQLGVADALEPPVDGVASR